MDFQLASVDISGFWHISQKIVSGKNFDFRKKLYFKHVYRKNSEDQLLIFFQSSLVKYMSNTKLHFQVFVLKFKIVSHKYFRKSDTSSILDIKYRVLCSSIFRLKTVNF